MKHIPMPNDTKWHSLKEWPTKELKTPVHVLLWNGLYGPVVSWWDIGHTYFGRDRVVFVHKGTCGGCESLALPEEITWRLVDAPGRKGGFV